MKSPLLFDVLRTVSQSDSKTNLARLARKLCKAESTVHAAVQRLVELDLVTEERSQANGRLRLYSIPPRNRKQVETILQQVLDRAVPQAMAELGRMISSGFRHFLTDWQVEDPASASGRNLWTRISQSKLAPNPDLILCGQGLKVVLEFKLGLHHFRKRIHDTIGRLVSMRRAQVDLVVLCVFGPVEEEYRRHLELILGPFFPPGKPEFLVLFLDEDPRRIFADPEEGARLISAKVVTPITSRIRSMLAEKSMTMSGQ
jgi:DNA-binding MarR family transcriptional regulator